MLIRGKIQYKATKTIRFKLQIYSFQELLWHIGPPSCLFSTRRGMKRYRRCFIDNIAIDVVLYHKSVGIPPAVCESKLATAAENKGEDIPIVKDLTSENVPPDAPSRLVVVFEHPVMPDKLAYRSHGFRSCNDEREIE